MAVARLTSGGVAIRYVLLVLWMTSRLAVVGRIAIRVYTTSGVVIPGRSLMYIHIYTSVLFQTHGPYKQVLRNKSSYVGHTLLMPWLNVM